MSKFIVMPILYHLYIQSAELRLYYLNNFEATSLK